MDKIKEGRTFYVRPLLFLRSKPKHYLEFQMLLEIFLLVHLLIDQNNRLDAHHHEIYMSYY